MSASKTKAAAAAAAAAEERATVTVTEVQDNYVPIDDLASVNINAADIDKLKAAGIHTVGSIFLHPQKHLLDIRGFSDTKVLWQCD